jgi:biopolymer transport protein ExbD
MNFRRGRLREDPEINLIPLIDLLLVILIFLMVTTTYNAFSEMKINLPTGKGDPAQTPAHLIHVAVAANGSMQVDAQKLAAGDRAGLLADLRRAAGGRSDAIVVVDADALSTHQSVIRVMEAAREAGLTQLTFATRSEP